jgi:transposase-like protein
MERRKFTREFKLEAVRLIKDRGVSYVQASQDLNVQSSQLRDWVKKLRGCAARLSWPRYAGAIYSSTAFRFVKRAFPRPVPIVKTPQRSASFI